MERASKVCVIPTVMGWSDVGNWGAVYDLSKKDKNGNAIVGQNIIAQNCTNCLIVNSSENKALVVDSLEEKIVVQTDKTSLTFPLGNDQAIKQIAKAVRVELGEDFV